MMTRKEQLCDECYDEPATLIVTVTTLDGTVQDRSQVCNECARELRVQTGDFCGSAAQLVTP